MHGRLGCSAACKSDPEGSPKVDKGALKSTAAAGVVLKNDEQWLDFLTSSLPYNAEIWVPHGGGDCYDQQMPGLLICILQSVGCCGHPARPQQGGTKGMTHGACASLCRNAPVISFAPLLCKVLHAQALKTEETSGYSYGRAHRVAGSRGTLTMPGVEAGRTRENCKRSHLN